MATISRTSPTVLKIRRRLRNTKRLSRLRGANSTSSHSSREKMRKEIEELLLFNRGD
jgi:hypothetical protein